MSLEEHTRHKASLLSLLLVATTLVAGNASAQQQKVWTAHYALVPGGILTIENVRGNITVEGWDRGMVQVAVTKASLGGPDLLDNVRILVEGGRTKLAFRTLHPAETQESVRVDYQVRVPRQVRLERLQTVTGEIVVSEVEGFVDARSLSGNIMQFNVAGRVLARATTGNVFVALRALPDGGDPLQLDTLSGDVSLFLPPRPNVDLELHSVAGSIVTPYVCQLSGKTGDVAQRTRVGRGGVLIQVRTVRGDIRVVEREGVL